MCIPKKKDTITRQLAIIYQKLAWARTNGARESAQYFNGQIQGFADCLESFLGKDVADAIIDGAITLSIIVNDVETGGEDYADDF